MESELVKCFGVVYHYDRITLCYCIKPFVVFALVFFIVILVIMITDIKRRVGDYAILMVFRQVCHTHQAIFVVYLIYFHNIGNPLFSLQQSWHVAADEVAEDDDAPIGEVVYDERGVRE